ncbi:MAG: pantoate--beta-alanine ligase [Solirubrobacteraceae bacterium]
MRTLRTIAELRAALAQPRREGARIGLVPTMGAFHEGHLSLMRRARADCDVVVVSLFVNPAQFDDGGEVAIYPRDEASDALLAAQTGVNHLFAPSVGEVYPDGFTTTVTVSRLGEVLEGAVRGAAHFDAVATMVTKLLNMVGPDTAYFGQKDVQQLLVIRRLVRDLNLPVLIEACPTVRDADGLALSSRNVGLSAAERGRATSLHRALSTTGERVQAGERDAALLAAEARALLDAAGVATEYFQIVNRETLAPVQTLDSPALAVVAARVGSTRLIDNQPLPTANGGALAAGSTKGLHRP